MFVNKISCNQSEHALTNRLNKKNGKNTSWGIWWFNHFL